MIDIKRLSEHDAPDIHSLYLEILQSFDELPQKAIDAYKAQWNREKIVALSQQEKSVILGAFTKNKPIGFLFGLAPEGGLATIIWLGVQAHHRKSGIGKKLIDEASKQYQNLQCHKIKLFTESPSALAFYQKIGFIHEGTHKKHWWGKTFWSLAKLL